MGSWAIYGLGNFYYTGSFTASSDKKLKKNIKTIEGSLNKVMQLQPRSYEFRTDEYNYIQLAQGPQFGFIAQEVEGILPEIVHEDTHGFADPQALEGTEMYGDPTAIKLNIKSMSYISLIPVLTGAIQEQQSLIAGQESEIVTLKNQLDARDNRITELESRLSRLEVLIENQLNRSSFNLERIDQIRLDQNQPNPFSGHTIIRYYLPESIERAQMVITDVTGRTIRSILLPEKGEGEVEITTTDLPGGTYQYSIVVEGRPVITKRMILSRGK
ncbi:MAG TPA: tail fiber domain-containing protein [Saprospiraceae bacterium]|nr:tail fiber domain-containing protein [Saprospiraceae bacterium]